MSEGENYIINDTKPMFKQPNTYYNMILTAVYSFPALWIILQGSYTSLNCTENIFNIKNWPVYGNLNL